MKVSKERELTKHYTMNHEYHREKGEHTFGEGCGRLIVYANEYCVLAEGTLDVQQRVKYIIDAEQNVARLRTFVATGRLWEQYMPRFEKLETRIRRLKSFPLVQRELWI